MIKIIFPLLFLLIACGKPIEEKHERKYQSALLPGVAEEALLGMKVYKNFNLLPLNGRVQHQNKFWSGNSWPLVKGAINFRWNSPGKETIGYLSPSRREVFSMPTERLKILSPSEKYDLYMGRYDYPLKYDVEWIARQGTMDWEGLCHGWAGASLNHAEPTPRVMVNPDGLKIPFGSSDIKALLSYAYSRVIIKDEEMLGKRCEKAAINRDENCENDLTAMSFHALLANRLGLRGKSFIADLERYKEVWNHPIIAYEARVLSMDTSGAGKIGIIRTTFEYLDVIEKNSWDLAVPSALSSKMTVEYELSLDYEGNITDSKWLTRERPDFLWVIPEVEEFDGYMKNVRNLIK